MNNKKFLIKLNIPNKNDITFTEPNEILYYNEGPKVITFETEYGLRKRIKKEDVKERNIIFIDAESKKEARQIYEDTELNNIKDDIEKLKNNIIEYSKDNGLDILYIIKNDWFQFYIKFNYKEMMTENILFKDGFKNLKIRFKNEYSRSFDEVLFSLDSLIFEFSSNFKEFVNSIINDFLNFIKEKFFIDTKLHYFDFGYIKTRNLKDIKIERSKNSFYESDAFSRFIYSYYDNSGKEKSFIIYFGDNYSLSSYGNIYIADDENSEENIKVFLDLQDEIRNKFNYTPNEKIDLVISTFKSYDYSVYIIKNGKLFKLKENNYYYSGDESDLIPPSLEAVGLAKLNSKFKLDYQQYRIEGDPKYIISHIKNQYGTIRLLDGCGNSIIGIESKRFEKKLFDELERNKDEIGEDDYNFYLSLYLLKYSTYNERDDINESNV